jgi:hypothetical protein
VRKGKFVPYLYVTYIHIRDGSVVLSNIKSLISIYLYDDGDDVDEGNDVVAASAVETEHEPIYNLRERRNRHGGFNDAMDHPQ